MACTCPAPHVYCVYIKTPIAGQAKGILGAWQRSLPALPLIQSEPVRPKSMKCKLALTQTTDQFYPAIFLFAVIAGVIGSGGVRTNTLGIQAIGGDLIGLN